MAPVKARLLSLLSLFETRSRWLAAELAARLHVSQSTLRRDIRTLRTYGYPIVTVSGSGGGYRLVDGAQQRRGPKLGRAGMRLRDGEVEATGWQVRELSSVVQDLRDEVLGVKGRPRVIAIDGRGGAGKTALSQRLHRFVPASAVVRTDDLAWNYANFDWAHLLAQKVLGPLHQGQGVNFTPDAWTENHRSGAVNIEAGLAVVWVEGTGTIRRELHPWIDASIWIQGDLDEQERRLTSRDGDSAAQRRHVDEWLAEEAPFMEREQPWTRATITVAGDHQLDHDPDTEIVIATSPPLTTPAAAKGITWSTQRTAAGLRPTGTPG